MGYKVKIQKVERPTNKSYYINFPAAIADSVKIEKGEDCEWLVENRNTFVLKRLRKVKSFLKKLT
jgi:antitoxin component of MazEF toxin-antitoxin module